MTLLDPRNFLQKTLNPTDPNRTNRRINWYHPEMEKTCFP